ncbi:nucleosome-remodeling factor subunit NURF301 isoform X2 [Acyrthosiphon pisum]|uniref:Nucleosome-remodeling factor subunit NURF301 n=1 Tax=Acyrthosiphon pisum TaxID=7029 RepID=A0A8R2A799_ACYPI|nr:nucleosome-remodeling factor subunit NURF301 isoform X2 [Acyrthosiphon pisum]|eukprot:XP_003241005.1 PREDICTED: nucleosome-remodeling factor subunit NURF301 isoform X2 [Acyrthosiphon pisum]
MSGRPKRRGRPPKTPGSDKPKFQMHLLKKPKYLQNLETVDVVVQSPPAPGRSVASRRSASASVAARAAVVVETPSRNTRRSNQKPKTPKTPKTPAVPKPRAPRPSTSKKKNTKKSTVDKSHDYHYGSDFDDSEKSEDPSESEQSDTNVEDAVDDVSDSDFSVSGFSVASRARKSNVSYIRNPSPEPLWLRDEEIPKLELPKSSEDLLVPTEHIMQALSVYEVLRRFKSQVRLSPFRFEDFCAALVYEEQSYLLAEVHIMLLKAILREEDLQQTHYGAVDQKDSINSVLYFMDTFTWPEVLREYIESDKSFDPQVLKVFNNGDEYPFTNIKNRLSVLQFLTDQFLTSTLIREDFIHEGHSFQYDDHCRVCHKVGDLLCCETCPAVFHLECAEPPLHDVPTEDWQCNLCKEHKVIGVSDCIPDDEKSGLSSRQDHLAYDRHGRKYWFLVRRIFIENEETGECWYYSTEEQLGLLLDSLDREMESVLFNEIEKVKEEINRQMKITMDLTLQYRPSNRKTFLDVENSYIIGMREEMQKKKDTEMGQNDSNIEESTENVKGDNESNNDGKQEQSNDVSVDKNENEGGNGDLKNDDSLIDVDDSEHNHSLRSTRNRSLRLKPALRQTPEQTKKPPVVEKPSPAHSYLDNLGARVTRFKAQHIAAGTYLYKLGMDNSFKTYVNQYSSNPTALNKIQKNEERDKKRYMSHKFSLTGPGEYKWCGQIFGARSTLISTVKQTIISLDNLLPSSLMHINWSVLRKPWLNQVNSCSTPKDFARVMVVLMSCIKPVVYAPVWHEQLGHVKLYRITHAEREEKKKTDKKDKKDKDAEEDERNKLTVHFVKYTLGLKHQVHKQKGEEYRIHGQWGWQWLSKTRDYKLADSSKQGLAAGPAKRIFQGKDDKGVRTFSIAETLYDSMILKECTFDSEASSEILDDQSVTHLDSVSDIDFINMKILLPIDKLDENINISSTLCSSSRIMYPKLAKKCKTDMLLPRRMQLKLSEERSIVTKNTSTPKPVSEAVNTTPPSASPQASTETITKMREKSYMLNTLQKRVIQLKQHYLSFNTMSEHMICYNRSCRAANKSSMIASCYSPLCIRHVDVRNELLSLLRKMNILKSELTELKASMPKDQGALNMKNEKTDNTPGEPVQIKTEVKKEENVIVKSEQVAQVNDVKTENITKQKDIKTENENEQNVKVDVTSCSPTTGLSVLKPARKRGGAKREGVLVDCIDDGRVYSTDDTRKKIYLKKLASNNVPVKKKAEKIKYPPTSRFYTRSKRCSLLVLPKHELRKLARHGGHDFVNGFNPNGKTNNAIWPYPCPRPYFKTCWLYRTIMFNTISAAALQLRILWACLKWDELTAKTAHLASKREVTTETELVTTETLECRTSGQFNEHTEYLIRKVVIPLDIPKQVREVTPIRSGLRKRKREEAPRNTAPQVSEVWVDESKLELVEIKQFHERVEREMQMQQAMKTRASSAFANKLLHNDSSHNRNINDKLRTQNSDKTEHIKEQLEQSLRAQRVAYKRTSVNNDNNSSNKKLCMDVSNSQSPVTSSSTQRLKLVPGEGGRLRLMPNNKPLAQNSPLLQSSTRVAAKPPTTTSTTPSTRRIFMTKCPDGKTRLVTTPKSIINDSNVMNQNSIKIQSTNSQIVTSNNVTQQKLQCIKGEDGKLQFKGLLPGQQLIQLPDGKLHVTSYINPSPSRTVQIGKNTMLANNNNFQKAGTQTIILNRGSQPIQQVIKPQPSQMVVSGGQLVNVSQGQQMIVQHINPNKATIATINGQQVLIRPNTVSSANILSSGGQTIKFVRPPQTVQKIHQSVPPLSPRVTPTTGIVQDQQRQVLPQAVPTPLVDEQEKLLLANQPPGTVIKCITAQVIQSPTHGNKIVLQGLQGNDFTPQQLQLVQQQVKQQLLKAQESSGTQGVLGPTKIYLAVQPPDSPLPTVQKPGIVAPITAQPTVKPIEPTPSVPVPNNIPESLTQIKTEPPSKSPVNKIPAIKEEPIDSPNSFVVTPNYISQSIKNVLKNEDLNPETQEKLLQLQKYQEQQLRDPVPQTSVPSSPARKRPYEADNLAEFEPPKKSTERDNSGSLVSPEQSKLYQTLKQGDDHRKMQQLQSKLQNEIAANVTVSSADSTTTSNNVTEKSIPVTPSPVQVTPPPQGSSKRKHASGPPTTIQTTPHANSNSKTSNSGPGRRRPMKISPPAPNRNHSRPSPLSPAKKSSPKKSKKEKIMCLCRTPYDSSKFYVGCDMCHNWFHGSCVGITVQMSKRISEWFCPECKRSKDPEVLYCICRKPYDDQQFYICCDKCQDWFHGSCVGVLQCEGDKMDDYNCPRCMSNSEINFANLNPLNQQDNDDLLKLVKQIHSHKSAWPFMEPVDPHEAPDYYNVVKEPMDLNCIGKNVTDKKYKNLTEFIRDMIKVFDNCRYYNPRESQFYKCAEILEQFFVSKLKNLRDKFCEQYMEV